MGRKLTTEERAALKETLKDTEGEEVVLAKIAEMSDSDRAMAERVHAIVMKAASGLAPRTWYGMPAYAKDGKVVCFFQDAAKFKARYSTIGFSDTANLDDGNMWGAGHTMMFYDEPSPALAKAFEAMGTPFEVFSFLQGLDADINVREEVPA